MGLPYTYTGPAPSNAVPYSFIGPKMAAAAAATVRALRALAAYVPALRARTQVTPNAEGR